MSGSDALDGHGALLLQSLPIPPLLLLLACLQPAAGMALQHTVLAAGLQTAVPRQHPLQQFGVIEGD